MPGLVFPQFECEPLYLVEKLALELAMENGSCFFFFFSLLVFWYFGLPCRGILLML